MKARTKHISKVIWKEWLKPLIPVALIIFAFRSSVADWNKVPTGSMKPTIIEGDRVFVDKLAYDLKIPFTRIRLAEWEASKIGDIVVFKSPENGIRMVKRVVAVPGDTVEMRSNHLFINGTRCDCQFAPGDVLGDMKENEIRGTIAVRENLTGTQHDMLITPSFASKDSFEEYQVPEGHIFVLGDNRDNSHDSRYFGPVPSSAVFGKATHVAWSKVPDEFLSYRGHRIFNRWILRTDSGFLPLPFFGMPEACLPSPALQPPGAKQ